jgi:tetratricopeptide (TPR) repeat protein
MVALAYAGQQAEAEREAEALEALRSEVHDGFLFDSLVGTVDRLGGRPAAALARQLRALERLPDDPVRPYHRMRVLVERGLAELDLGLDVGAERSLLEALALSATEQRRDTPLRADAWVGLGVALGHQRRAVEALGYLERADAFWRGFDPDNPSAANAARLATTARAVGHRPDAVAAVRPAGPR